MLQYIYVVNTIGAVLLIVSIIIDVRYILIARRITVYRIVSSMLPILRRGSVLK